MADIAPRPTVHDHGEAAGARPRTGTRRLARSVGRSTVFWYLAAIGLVLAGWQLTVLLTDTPDYLLPPPADVGEAIWTYRAPLLDHGWFTLREIAVAFALAIALGVAIAVPIAFSSIVARLSYPLLVMGQAIPKIALGPLFIVWFGFGFQTNVLIAASVAIFPIIVNTALGLSSIDPDLVRLGRSMGASWWRLFRLLRWPAALPSIVAGLKVGITFAVIGVVVGEFIVGGAGLGYLTLSASGNQNVPLLFACILSLAILGVLTFAAVELVGRAVLRRHTGGRQW